jgi:glycosyltransferase involved in cell wall biosynthesis
MILLILLFFSLITLTIYFILLKNAISDMSYNRELSDDFQQLQDIKLSVIIPAYNEANNIEDCVTSILDSTDLSAEQLEVWVVDDESSDNTLMLLENLQRIRKDARLKILAGKARPNTQSNTQVWAGKNWACHQGVQRACGDFLLFIDADVRLNPRAIETVFNIVNSEQIEFFNCIPAVVCQSLVEWLVQPLMFINLLVSLNSKAVKNSQDKTTYAFGPFMFFRRSVYYKIGGHEAVKSEVAEDVALAKLIKSNGFKSKCVLGTHLARLRMYTSWASLWEGWTKVLYVGSQRSWGLMFLLAVVMLNIYFLPWFGLFILFGKSLIYGWVIQRFFGLCVALSAIVLQWMLRLQVFKGLDVSFKYWWLHWLGGLLIAVMAIVSAIKTETGWGWTWRGRKLYYFK